MILGIGERVRKKKGYKFEGLILSVFAIPPGYPKSGVVMANVIHDDGWVMHFQMDDLEPVHGGTEDGQGRIDDRGRIDRRGAGAADQH